MGVGSRAAARGPVSKALGGRSVTGAGSVPQCPPGPQAARLLHPVLGALLSVVGVDLSREALSKAAPTSLFTYSPHSSPRGSKPAAFSRPVCFSEGRRPPNPSSPPLLSQVLRSAIWPSPALLSRTKAQQTPFPKRDYKSFSGVLAGSHGPQAVTDPFPFYSIDLRPVLLEQALTNILAM